VTHPLLYEVFARTWLRSTGARTLADIPDAELDRLAALGFDHLWLMGVWTLGPDGRAQAQRYFPGEDVAGSPYAVAAYAVSPDFGGDAALAKLRARLAARGVRLILDFIPNHTARDHHWMIDAPDLYVRDGTGGIACGKDPFFPPWTDTAQLDYRNVLTRDAMTAQLLGIAELCDGVRCDMAMLVLPDIFAKTWGGEPGPDFWSAAIDAVRARHRSFTFIAETYWGLERRLQRLGFDFTYDKELYDLLVSGTARDIRRHLTRDLDEQNRSVRFLENHDEPRLAHELALPRRAAALYLALTLPGMRLIHDGQLEGRTLRMPIQLAARVDEPADPDSLALHERVLALLRRPALRAGAFRILSAPAPLIAHRWELGAERIVIVVNFSDAEAQGHVSLDVHGIAARTVDLHDLVDGATYARDGDEELHVILAPWQVHVFEVR
jgi:hypothetical protein